MKKLTTQGENLPGDVPLLQLVLRSRIEGSLFDGRIGDQSAVRAADDILSLGIVDLRGTSEQIQAAGSI